jgi:hypothetical protein
MPFPHRSIARIALLAAATIALGACSLTSSVTGTRDWSSEATLPDGSTQTITVHDDSGRLTNVEINPAGVPFASEISNPAGAANVVLVPWAGGACDVRTEFVFASDGQGLAGTIKVTTSGDICTMQAIQQQLRLTSSTPLPAAQVTLDPAP